MENQKKFTEIRLAELNEELYENVLNLFSWNGLIAPMSIVSDMLFCLSNKLAEYDRAIKKGDDKCETPNFEYLSAMLQYCSETAINLTKIHETHRIIMNEKSCLNKQS